MLASVNAPMLATRKLLSRQLSLAGVHHVPPLAQQVVQVIVEDALRQVEADRVLDQRGLAQVELHPNARMRFRMSRASLRYRADAVATPSSSSSFSALVEGIVELHCRVKGMEPSSCCCNRWSGEGTPTAVHSHHLLHEVRRTRTKPTPGKALDALAPRSRPSTPRCRN